MNIEEKIRYYEILIKEAKDFDTSEFTIEETEEYLNLIARMEQNLQLYYAIRNINI